MENVEQTKLRLLREAVEDNITARRPVKTPVAVRRGQVFPFFVTAFLAIAVVVYLSIPWPGVTNGTAKIAGHSQTDLPTSHSDSHSDEPLPPQIPGETPKRLNRSVFPLAVRKIVIDPGHGGEHTGAISDSGVTEKEITLDIALRLRRLMKESSIEAMLTRETDRHMSLADRVAFANTNNADLFVSIHINFMEPRTIRAMETYYVGPTEDPVVIQLTGMENRESGYSLSDYRGLLEKVYMHTRRDESRRLAKSIHTELYQSLSKANPRLEDRGVRTAPFVVLIGTQMPAILVEVSCLSNEDEVRLLTNADYRERIAGALLNGIRSYADSLNGSGKKGS
jgi:N-acetylmuramoyl-L-alanine amidase